MICWKFDILLSYCLWLLSHYNKLHSCNRGYMAHNVENIYYVALYKEEKKKRRIICPVAPDIRGGLWTDTQFRYCTTFVYYFFFICANLEDRVIISFIVQTKTLLRVKGVMLNRHYSRTTEVNQDCPRHQTCRLPIRRASSTRAGFKGHSTSFQEMF